MILYTLASSSRGNCALVSHNEQHILIDAGISMRRIVSALKTLGLSPGDLSAILVTHAHTDHVSALPMLTRHYALPVFASRGTASELRLRCPELSGHLHSFLPGEELSLEAFSLKSFPTPHDAADSVGYSVAAGGRRLAFVTDLGYVTKTVLESAAGADAVLLEANHDLEMLLRGPYPYSLKQRVAGDHGHLSNEASGELAAALARSGTRQIVLAHLSRENNIPELAEAEVRRALEAAGFFPGRDLALSVAPKDEMGPCHRI